MNKNLILKIKESLTSVLPITVIVLLLNFTIAPMDNGTMGMFLVGAILLIVGMGFFTLGADLSMMEMGEKIGAHATKMKKLPFTVLIFFIIGVIITIAEPDLQVLANQVPSVPNNVIIWSVAVGVGTFLAIALLRTIFQIKLSHMLWGFYGLLFVVAAFAPQDFLAVAFDSGGVTTGPMTVPFIMALGLGISAMRGDKSSREDSFGLVGLSSIGPILAVLLLGIFYKPSGSYESVVVPKVRSLLDILREFFTHTPEYMKEVATALLPIVVFFFIFQAIFLKIPKRQLIKIVVGLVYTYIGLVLFLTGVNVGFMPVGNLLGSKIASLSYNWILIPLGMVIGYFIVAAEPAVHVLNKQVEEVSGGSISRKAMQLSLSIGVAVSLALAMIRVLTGISIWYLILPGYGIALGLTFFVPKIFTAIAFDSGGVASGPMTATFLLPFAMGACEAVGGNVLTDAFGVVAMVAMTPLVTIQILGLVFALKEKKSKLVEIGADTGELVSFDDEIYHYDE